MAEIFPHYNLPLDELINAYTIEAYGLSSIISSPQSSNLLKQYIDYDSYLKARSNNKNFSSYLSKKNGVIYSDDSHPFFREALHSAHLSACCALFNGHTYTKQQLDSSNFSYLIKTWLSKYSNNASMIQRLSFPLHTLDAVRTIQILRALSLINIRTSNIRQISFGAGPAEKDITALHSLPKLVIKPSKIDDEPEFSFSTKHEKAEHIIISDNDPQRKEQYINISKTDKNNVLGLNIDTYEALAECRTLNQSNKIGARNFIVALRIDHRMLPDIPLFFKLLSECMDQSADLIISMGSGHTIDDFEGRTNKLMEIFEFLRQCKLKPTLLKLHAKGTLEQQRQSNSFSTIAITTHQILHCKLKSKILKKALL